MSSELRCLVVTTAVITTFTLADLNWLPASTVSISPQSYIELIKVLAAIAAAGVVCALIKRRLKSDPSRFGTMIANYAGGAATLCLNLGLFAIFTLTMTIFTYLASATDRALVDAHLAAIDLGFGFDWLSVLTVVNGWPIAAQLLVVAYHSLAAQLAAVFLLLSFTGRGDHLAEFLASMAAAGLVTAVIMALFPSAGAYAYFQPAGDQHSSFSGGSGLWHYSHLMQLRSGETFVLDQVEGLVTFPSFHTVLGFLIPYALRHTRWLFVPALLLNTGMVAATIPEGGHYLIDVIAGAIVAVVSIGVVRLTIRMNAETHLSSEFGI